MAFDDEDFYFRGSLKVDIKQVLKFRTIHHHAKRILFNVLRN